MKIIYASPFFYVPGAYVAVNSITPLLTLKDRCFILLFLYGTFNICS